MSKSVFGHLFTDFRKGTVRKTRKIIGLPLGKDPWMAYKEIDIFLEILDSLKPQNCLEFGCGYSSLYYPGFLSPGATWTSVEHNKEWFEKIVEKSYPVKNLTLYNILPNAGSWEKGGNYSDFKNYVDFPRSLNLKFDLILVDGVAREACIEAGLDLLSDNGLLIVHDCNRVQYQNQLKRFPYWVIFEDFRKSAGGFGFASRKNIIPQSFEIKKHASVWKIDTKINNFFKFKYLIGKPSKPFQLKLSHPF